MCKSAGIGISADCGGIFETDLCSGISLVMWHDIPVPDCIATEGGQSGPIPCVRLRPRGPDSLVAG